MKHLGLEHILLLLGVGLLLLGSTAAELTADQNLMSSAEVGQMVTVTVSLTYNGQNSTEVVVTPVPPPGVVANAGGQSIELSSGRTQRVSYPIAAQQSGTYWIVSEISYAEDGTWRSLRLEAPFTAIAPVVPQPQPMPGVTTPGVGPDGSNPTGEDPFPMPSGGVLPDGVPPHDAQPDNNGAPDSGSPEDMPPDGFNPGTDQEEQPHEGQ